MEKYWFYLESHIHVNFKPGKMLLYDTHTGQSIVEESPKAINIVQAIYEDANLGSVELCQEEINDPIINDFIERIISGRMGQLQKINPDSVKPVILLPILSLNLDVERFKNKDNMDLFLARDISKYLLDINIVLNSFCQQKCQHCEDYCKQFFCCSKGNMAETLSYDDLHSILYQIGFYPVRTINITGGNIYKYHNLEMFNVLNKEGKKVFNFYIHYLNYEENAYVDRQNIHIIINTPVNREKLREVYSLTKAKEVKYHLIVEDEGQYSELEQAMTELEIDDFEIHPFYNGQNIHFFEENVYLSVEDVVATPISMREIFRNQKLNANSFGSLYILPNGDIKANLNEETIGHLGKERIVDVINYEMMQNTAWRKVRSSEPCKDCVYQFLCPPPSNYERAVNRQNLCHIQK